MALAPLPDFAKWGSVERKPMTGIRRKTAEHMQQAWAIRMSPTMTKPILPSLRNCARCSRSERKRRAAN